MAESPENLSLCGETKSLPLPPVEGVGPPGVVEDLLWSFSALVEAVPVPESLRKNLIWKIK